MALPNWIEERLPADERKRNHVKLSAGIGLMAAAIGLGAVGISASRPPEIPKVFKALSVGDGSAVRAALESDKAVVEATDIEGNTPLHIAAASGWADIVGVLLDAGADPTARNRAGWTPLFAALEAPPWGQGAVVHTLLAKGAAPDVELPDGQTVLHVAANTPTTDPNVVPLLVRDKALVRRADHAGRTPLQLARASNLRATEQVLRWLQDGGATGATAASN
jgi:ankyrin repeat protein